MKIIYKEEVFQWYFVLLERCKAYLHNFLFFEMYVSVESHTFDKKLENFIKTIDTFEENDFSCKISSYFESSIVFKKLNFERISYSERINYYFFKFLYSGRKSARTSFKHKFFIKSRVPSLIKTYAERTLNRMKRLRSTYIYKKIVFFKGIYYHPDDVTGIRSLSTNILEFEAYLGKSTVGKFMVFKNTELFFLFFKAQLLELFMPSLVFLNVLKSLNLLLRLSHLNSLLPYKPQFWSFFKRYLSDWQYYTRAPHYEKNRMYSIVKDLKDLETSKNIINLFVPITYKSKKIPVTFVRSSFRDLRRRPLFNKQYNPPIKNVYCSILDLRAKSRYNKKLFRPSRRTKLMYKGKNRKIFNYKRVFIRRNFRKLKYFSKSFKSFRSFLDTQNLSTLEKEATYRNAVSSMLELKSRTRKAFTYKKPPAAYTLSSKVDNHVLDSNFKFSLNFNSLNYFTIPVLETSSDSEFLFTSDAPFGQSHNLRPLSNPDFFWDEWDTSFMRQQNGLSQEIDLYEDNFFGEDRFFSPSIPAEQTDDSVATKDDSTDLILQTDTHLEWRFHPERYREPHRKFRFRPLSAKRTSDFDYFYPPDNNEISKIYREFPDWSLVPGLHTNQPSQEEILVGDGPSNYNPLSPEKADTIFRPEFSLQHDMTDPFDSTILYDWYTLQRVQSAFSERHPNVPKNTFKEYFSLPYASSILNCEDHFYRAMYKDHKRVLVGKNIDNIDFDGEHYFWDISVELPELNPDYNSKDKLKMTSDYFVGSSIMSLLRIFPRSSWQERISRNPVLKFASSFFEDFRRDDIESEHFRDIGVKRARAFFYDERSLNKKFNNSNDLFYGVERFSWLTEIFIFFVLLILSLHVLFKYLLLDGVSIAVYSNSFFQFWDQDSGLPAISRSRTPFSPHSRYGGFINEKIKILKKVYKKYNELPEYRYNVAMKKRTRPSYVPTNYLHAFFTGLPERHIQSVEILDTDFRRIMFGQHYSAYRLIDRYYTGLTKLASRKKSPRLELDRAVFLNSPSLFLEPDLSFPYKDDNCYKPRKSLKYALNGAQSGLVKRFDMKREGFLGDLLYKKYYFRGVKNLLKYPSVRVFNLNTAISGPYGLNTQYLSFERPYSLDVAKHNFLERANRIFTLNRQISDRYHTSWRPYDIFFTDLRLSFNIEHKPPLTTLIHEQNTSTSLTKSRTKIKRPRLLSFLMNDKPRVWDETNTTKISKFRPKFLNMIYVYWNRLYQLNWTRPIPFSYDSFVAGDFLRTTNRPYVSLSRLPYTYFYLDNLEQITTTPKLKKRIDDEYKDDILDIIRAKSLLVSPTPEEEEETLRPFRNFYRSSKPIIYNRLFEQSLSNDKLLLYRPVLKSFPYVVWSTSPIYENRELSYDNLSVDQFIDNYPIKSLSVSKPAPQYTIGSLRKPIYSNRNRMFKYFKLVANKRVRSNILPFGLDLFNTSNIIGADSQPIFSKNTLPFISVDKALSFNDLDNNQTLRFFLLLDNMSNKFQSSEYNSVSGFKSYWFSKTNMDPVNRSHRTLLHVGSNYQTAFVLNIPTYWETYYNSLWIKNLPDIYRTNSSDSVYDESRRAYSYGQNQSIFYFISFIEDILIDRLIHFYDYCAKNLIFIRNVLFFLSFLYIFISHRSILKQQFLKIKKINGYTGLEYLNLANKSLVPKITSVKVGRRKSFNISLFRSLKSRYGSLQKQMIAAVVPELYNSGGKRFQRLFLKRPKSFKNYLLSSSRNSIYSRISIPNIKKNPKSTSLNNFSSISSINYSFLWSLHPCLSQPALNGKNRQFLYRSKYKNFYKGFCYNTYIKNQLYKQSYKYNNQNLFFEKRSLPYKLIKRSVFIQGYIFHSSKKSSYVSPLSYSDNSFNLEFYKPEYYNFDEFIFKKNKALSDPFSVYYTEKGLMTEQLPNSDYFQDNNFSNRRQVWSESRYNDRKSHLSYDDKIINDLDLDIFNKALTRDRYYKELSSLNTQIPFTSETSSYNRAVDELLSFNTKFIDPTLPYSHDLSSRFSEEIGPLLDLDEDDSDERVEDSIDHEVEPIDDAFPLNPESDDTEDHFESIFVELIHKFSSPESSLELSVNSLLKSSTSHTLLKKSAMSPVKFDTAYNVHSELISYSLWRIQNPESYVLDMPVVQLSLPTSDFDVPDEQIVNKFYFNPLNFGMPIQYSASFLVPYSLPRFLKRLDAMVSEYGRDYNQHYSVFTSKYYDPTDPEGFDIKPFSWLSGLAKDRPSRLSQFNPYVRLKENFSDFELNPLDMNPTNVPNFEKYDLNVGNSYVSIDPIESVTQYLDPFSGDFKYKSGSSLLAEDFFSSLVEESSDNNLLDINELSHAVYSYNLEEEDESVQLFETSAHYKWRFLSREYLLNLYNRSSEFEYTQLRPFTTTKDFNLSSNAVDSENFNFSKFLSPLSSRLYYSEFGSDTDLVNDFISHWPDYPQVATEDLFIEFLVSELDLEGDGMPNAIFDQDVGDEDIDLVEDNEDNLQSSNPIIIKEGDLSPFDLSLDLLLREVDVSDFSLENEDVRQDDSLRVSASSMFISKSDPSGFAVFPVRDPYEIRKKEYLHFYNKELKFSTVHRGKKSTEDPSFPFIDLDLADLLIPVSQNKVTRVFEDNDQVVVSDTMDRVIGYLKPVVVKRATSDLLQFRAEIIKKNLDISLVDNVYSTVVSNKDLLSYLFLIQSPELTRSVARVRYGVIHELEQASLEELTDLEDYSEQLDFLSKLDRWYFMDDFEEFKISPFKSTIHSELYEREALRNDLIDRFDPLFNLFIRDTNSLKFFAITNLYFKSLGITYENVTT